MRNNDSTSRSSKSDYEGKKSQGNSYKGKNGKRRFNNNSKVADRRSDRSTVTEANVDDVHTNDISWWNKANPLFIDATRVPFNRIVGDPIITTAPSVPEVVDESYFEGVPGIMRFDYLPTIGYAADSNDPVNRSFTSIYGDIYSRTTGAMQFTQSDLALFVLGVSSIIQMIGVMKRALGVCQLYASKNYYYPRHLLHACGFNPTDVINNQDEYRRRLNQTIQSVNALRVPNFIDLFKRHYTLASNVWLDEDSPDAQMFVFTPYWYYAYNDVGSKLDATATGLTNSTGADFITKIEAAIALWRNSSDLGLISGSIQRAYKDASLLTLEMVVLDSVVLPVFDKTMLLQINNAVIMPLTLEDIDITQDVVANVTKFKPRSEVDPQFPVYASQYCRREVILNSFEGDVSPEAVMEMTRLVIMGTYNVGDGYIDFTTCGTEILVGWQVYYTSRETAASPAALEILNLIGSYHSIEKDETVFSSGIADIVAYHSAFRNGPRLELCMYEAPIEPATEHTIYGRLRVGDLYKYTTLDLNAFSGLQAAALQSIFVVSEVTKPNNFNK